MWAPPSSKPNYLKASSSKLGFRASTYQLEEIHSALNCVCVCLSTFFLALHMLQANCVYFLHSLEAAISPRSPGSLYWRTILETKIWAADVLTAAGVPLLLGLLSRKSKKTCVCTPTLMQINIHKYFLCIHLCLYETKYQFILKSSNIIHYQIDHLNFSPYFSVTSYSNSKRHRFHHPPSIYLIVQFQCTCIAVPELLTHNPEKQL